ncbi:MAG: hypothetical protein KDB27_08740 [Planctomycetales bacterium]|nr:hypothetical protein [Planctomycetales bacterium]
MSKIAAILALLLLSASALAQQDDAANPKVQENPLSILYAKNASGQYIPVLNGLQYDEINEYLRNRIARSDRMQPDRATLANLALTGGLHSEQSQVRAVIVLQIRRAEEKHKNENDWLRIPLGLHEAALIESPEFEGNGECIFQRDRTDGFIAWYRGSDATSITIRLDLSAPTTQLAESSELSLTLPKATQSSFEATIEGQSIIAEVIGGRISDERQEEGSLFVKCVGLQERYQISWRTGDTNTAKPQVPARLDVEADIDATFEQVGIVSSNVKLQLSSNREIGSFDVRVPANAEITLLDRSNYKARARSTSAESAFRQYEINMTTPATEQTVDLRIELRIGSPESAAPDIQTNIAAVEVVDSQSQTTVRQFGQVRLFNKLDARVSWKTGPGVQRVNDVLLDTSPELLAVFKYARQPCSINVWASLETTRVAVTPLQVLSVETNRIYLRSVFQYQIRGGSLNQLTVKLDDWEYDYVTFPDGIQYVDQYDAATSTLTIFFQSPVSDDFELRVRSHKLIEPPTAEMSFPVADADSTSQPVLLIGAADNVMLDFPEHQPRGFLQVAIPTDLREELPAITSTQPVRCFRMQSERQARQFLLNVEVREQRVHLSVTNLVQLSDDTVQIRQRFAFEIQYERLERLRFELPQKVYDLIRDTSRASRISTTINGVSFPAIEWLRSIDVTGSNAIANIQLPEAMIGSSVVDVSYTLDDEDFAVGEVETIDIPLLTSRIEKPGTVSNQIVVNPNGVRVEWPTSDSEWKINQLAKANFPIETMGAAAEGTIGLNAIAASSIGQPKSASVVATADDSIAGDTSEKTRVDRFWVHTTLSNSRRRDQIAFQLHSGRPQVQIDVPGNPSPAAVRVWVNNNEVEEPNRYLNANTLSIPLGDNVAKEDSRRSFLVEVELDYNERPAAGNIAATLPFLTNLSECGRWIWQLTLPPSEHLITSDDRLVPAQPWTWRGWFFSRNPNVQAVLENWVGTTNLRSTPGGNEYVFRSLVPLRTTSIRSASRRALVAVASGCALAFGLMLIYLGELRQPIVLLLAALTLVTFGLLFPGPAVLMAQASVIGVCLALVGQWTALFIRRLSISRQLLQIPAQKRHDSSSFLQHQWSEGTSQAATASMPHQDREVVGADSNG